MPNQRMIIHGDPEGQHLRAEWNDVEDAVRFVSRELATSQVQTRWRERPMFTMPKRLVGSLARLLGAPN